MELEPWLFPPEPTPSGAHHRGCGRAVLQMLEAHGAIGATAREERGEAASPESPRAVPRIQRAYSGSSTMDEDFVDAEGISQAEVSQDPYAAIDFAEAGKVAAMLGELRHASQDLLPHPSLVAAACARLMSWLEANPQPGLYCSASPRDEIPSAWLEALERGLVPTLGPEEDGDQVTALPNPNPNS